MSITCNWKSSKSLPLAILPPGQSIDESEDAADLDSLVELIPLPNITNLEFIIQCKHRNAPKMDEIYIVSVGIRKVECFAESGEYLYTISGQSVIADPEFHIESLRIPCHGSQFLKIKAFTHHEPSKPIYILNIQVSTISTLKKKKQDLSKNAEEFKNMFETFQSQKASSMMGGGSLPPPLPFLNQNPTHCKCNQELEKMIMKRIESMEKRTEEKLDKILNLLEKREFSPALAREVVALKAGDLKTVIPEALWTSRAILVVTILKKLIRNRERAKSPSVRFSRVAENRHTHSRSIQHVNDICKQRYNNAFTTNSSVSQSLQHKIMFSSLLQQQLRRRARLYNQFK
ncbi:unnamed protein product [Lepeophtheirus salmonis]|uniref:(salmon louse) hypothetical protein n=1 Tax=Lepeophtheirus salmonis TaxID=72036 RepID=A0A7R8CD07_LEPSM|nr:unnamed protein product [Lepeophtheirus salmonis]CAF2774772.1 unnamed protein product [Lepeophtheirus salmonis]